jgi:prevent-host-death family protein
MRIVQVSEARTKLTQLMDDVAAKHQPIMIAGKRNSAVMLALDDWTAIQGMLFLSTDTKMRQSIRDGMNTPVNQLDSSLDW